MKVAVLLATYNGEEFISQQIESLLSQTYEDFSIFVSDDCSTDMTLEIINEYCHKYPDKIHILSSKKRFGGACLNFLNLFEMVDSDIYLCCDQDDIWVPNKIEFMIREYLTINYEQPILLFSDLFVVDRELNIINNSFTKMMNLSVYDNTWKYYSVQNNVTGCAMLVNKKLVDIYKKNIGIICKDNIVMHDYFFAFLASVFGNIFYLNKSLVQYRQHGNNVVGAKKVFSLNYLIRKLKNLQGEKEMITKIRKQANEILKLCNSSSLENNIDLNLLQKYAYLERYCRVKRIIFLIRYNFLKKSLIRRIGQILLI